MDQSPYQLYGLEFYVAHLKTSLDLINLRVEMRLFNAPFVVIKSNMNFSQSMWVLKSQYVMPRVKTDEEDLEPDPFVLDLRSVSVLEEEEVEVAEEEFTDYMEMEEAAKMAAYDPCTDTTTKDGSKKAPKVVQESQQEMEPAEAETLPQELPNEGTQESINLKDKRSQLRMFPDDPTGLPYNKVRKEQPSKGDDKKRSELNVEVTPIAEVDRKSKVKMAEGISQENLPDDKRTPGDGDQEKYTIVEAKMKNLPPQASVAKTASIKDFEKFIDKTAEVLPSDIFESGVTLVMPMKPLEMLYNLQKKPLHVKVMNEDDRFCSEAFLDLWPLFECVIRAERGPPTPVVSSCEVTLRAHGDFDADISTVIRLFAYGNYSVSKITSPIENPNEEAVSFERPPPRHPYTEVNKDIQPAPPMLSSPENLPRIPPRKLTQLEEEIQLAKKDQDEHYAQNIAFCPIHRIVTPQPKDNYETMRWKIDKLLGLTEVSIEEYELPDEEKTKTGLPVQEQLVEEVDDLEQWHRNKRKELRSKWKRSNQTRAKTRNLLQKILMGIENPDPIRSKPEVLQKDVGFGEEEEDEGPQEELPEEELKARKARFLFDEIRRQQQEERMIKHYKRVFRLMLRVLETERGVDRNEQRRRTRERKRLQDLLGELETYQAEDVRTAFIKVTREKMKKAKRTEWDPDVWPQVPEEEEGEQEEFEEEDDENALAKSEILADELLDDVGGQGEQMGEEEA